MDKAIMDTINNVFPVEYRDDDTIISEAFLQKEGRRVLLVTHNLTRTGAPLVLKDLAQILLKNGDLPIVLSPVHGPLQEDFRDLGITVIIRHNKGKTSFASKEFRDLFDLAIVNTIVGYEAIKELRYSRLPVMWWIHEGKTVIKSFERDLPRFLTENIKVSAVSVIAQQALECVKIPYASECFHGGVTDCGGVLSSKINNEKTQFLLVGTLSYIKGHDILIEAIKGLSKRHMEKAEFYLIGMPFESEMVNLVKSTEKSNANFHYLGELPKDQVLERIASSDCMISVSREDTLPIVLAEGLMLNKACLCSSSIGIASLLKDGVSGFIFDGSDDLIQKLEYIIDHPEHLKEVALNGRKVYESEFTMEQFEKSALRVIESTVEQYSRQGNSFLDFVEHLNHEKEAELLQKRPRLYYDDGEGFSEGKIIQGEINITENQYAEKVFLPIGIKRLRFDPVEGKCCVLKNITFNSNQGIQPFTIMNGFQIEEFTIFNSYDPQLLINITQEVEWLELKCTYYLFDQSDLQLLLMLFRQIPLLQEEKTRIEKNNLIDKTSLMDIIAGHEKTLLTELNKVEGYFSRIEKNYVDEIQRLSLEINSKDESNKNLKQELQNNTDLISKTKHEMDTIVNNFSEQLHQAEEKVSASKEEIEEKISRINYLENIINDLKGQVIQREVLLKLYDNSTSWRMTKPFRAISTTLKKLTISSPIGTLLFKGLISLRQEGIRHTFRKVKLYRERQKSIQSFTEETGYDIGNDNLAEFSAYDSEYQGNKDYSDYKSEVKALAFYLPQFHTFPENDAWWGKGFTEWVNTKKAMPRFEGHYQPREPHFDIGYYDLSDIEVLRRQAKLAKQHGIYGFCFYYYWFSGKRLMEKPVDMLLENPDIDLPFCLCWANENWTRAWDGRSKEIIMQQNYDDQDPDLFIDDMQKYINDARYIRVHGKPVIIVYNPGEINQISITFSRWRDRARAIGIGEILIWTCQTANNTAENLKITSIIDAEVEFPPHNMWHDIIGIRNLDLNGKEAFIYNYQKLVEYLKLSFARNKQSHSSTPVYRSCMLGWDNAARRESKWTTFYGFSLKSLYKWILLAKKDVIQNFDEEERFLFINAWNEWAEGTYLEPDMKFGYANINTVSKALFDLPFDDKFKVINYKPNNVPSIVNDSFDSNDRHARIAVQVHLFYTDTIEEIIRNLNLIPYRYDCYISTDTLAKEQYIRMMFQKHCTCEQVYVKQFPNRGRDVAPFLIQISPVLQAYDYVCHIHSKKTKTAEYGDDWRKYLYSHLFGSREYLLQLFELFETDKQLGIVFPETYPVLQRMAEWGGNKPACYELLERLGINAELPSDPVFPVGNMFWARTEAIKAILQYPFQFSDFPLEKGQTNFTIAHQIERIWVYVAHSFGYSYLKTFNNSIVYPDVYAKRIAFYVHYDKENVISEDDVFYVKEMTKLTEEFIFITNSSVGEEELKKIRNYVSNVIKRSNIGFDFGAWKEGLFSYGFDNLKKFDQLLLLNNSCRGPFFNMNMVFQDMNKQDIDFWGITLFPELKDGSYLNKNKIHEHIQSYFQVFNRNVFEHQAFIDFWNGVKNYSNLIDVIANCESEMTNILVEAGFKYSIFIKETKLLSRYLNNYSIPYEMPTSLLLLRSPFIKKKCMDYMSDMEKNNLIDISNQITK